MLSGLFARLWDDRYIIHLTQRCNKLIVFYKKGPDKDKSFCEYGVFCRIWIVYTYVQHLQGCGQPMSAMLMDIMCTFGNYFLLRDWMTEWVLSMMDFSVGMTSDDERVVVIFLDESDYYRSDKNVRYNVQRLPLGDSNGQNFKSGPDKLLAMQYEAWLDDTEILRVRISERLDFTQDVLRRGKSSSVAELLSHLVFYKKAPDKGMNFVGHDMSEELSFVFTFGQRMGANMRLSSIVHGMIENENTTIGTILSTACTIREKSCYRNENLRCAIHDDYYLGAICTGKVDDRYTVQQQPLGNEHYLSFRRAPDKDVSVLPTRLLDTVWTLAIFGQG